MFCVQSSSSKEVRHVISCVCFGGGYWRAIAKAWKLDTPKNGKWWRTQQRLRFQIKKQWMRQPWSKACLKWFGPALPRNLRRDPRDQGIVGDVSENVPRPTTLEPQPTSVRSRNGKPHFLVVSRCISPYVLDSPWTWMETITINFHWFLWTHVPWILARRTVRPRQLNNSLEETGRVVV